MTWRLFLILFSTSALAATSSSTVSIPTNRSETLTSQSQPSGTDDDIHLQLQFRPEVSGVMSQDEFRQTVGAGMGLVYGVSPKMGIGSGIRHVFDPSIKADSVFTEFDVRMVFAPTGGLMLTPDQFKDEWKRSGGWRISALITQYYFGGEVTPSSGMGLGAGYEWPLSRRLNSMVGTRLDRVSDGTLIRFPVEAYAGIGYRL